MTHLTMVYKWHRQYIATKDELFRMRKQRDELLAVCEALVALKQTASIKALAAVMDMAVGALAKPKGE